MPSTPVTPDTPTPSTPPTEQVFSFPPTAPPKLCSYNTCASQHQWPLTLTLAKCGGCGTHVLAALMNQCPVCNEPPEVSTLRTDHVSGGMKVMAVCHGEPSPGEVGVIEMHREHAKSAETPDPLGLAAPPAPTTPVIQSTRSQ